MTTETISRLNKAFKENRERKNKLIDRSGKDRTYVNKVLSGVFYNREVLEIALEILQEEIEKEEKLNQMLDKIA
jgi:septal ring factor EnvC (AmiA/AmiB activator)